MIQERHCCLHKIFSAGRAGWAGWGVDHGCTLAQMTPHVAYGVLILVRRCPCPTRHGRRVRVSDNLLVLTS
jgi:hypothetical protein